MSQAAEPPQGVLLVMAAVGRLVRVRLISERSLTQSMWMVQVQAQACGTAAWC